jgi:acyl-CoA thioester hydrolase
LTELANCPVRSASNIRARPAGTSARASVRAVPETFTHELRVRYGECDPQGIVFNANYLLYFDVAFTELWREAVEPWQEMVQRGVDAVVAETNLRFHAPARFDDELSLQVRIASLGRTALKTEIDIRRGEELLLAGWLRHVCVDTATMKGVVQPCPWPEDIRGKLASYVAEADDQAR